MKTKICKRCSKEFTAQRDDASFCSSSCRSLFWQNNKSQKKAEEEFQKQLKGLVNDNPEPVIKTITEVVPNKEFIALQLKLKQKEEDAKKLQQQKMAITKELQILKNMGAGNIVLLGASAGTLIGYSHAKEDKRDPNKRLAGAFKGGIWGCLSGIAFELLTKERREKQQQLEIRELNVRIQDINAKLTLLDTEIDELKAMLSKTKRLLTIEKEVIIKTVPNLRLPLEKSAVNTAPKRELNVYKQLTTPAKTADNVNPGSKIISSAHLTEMEYQALNFQGRWQYFFGLPSLNFHCALHGMAGEGKSTFAIQFANYLAVNFGRVIYISGEEGFSKTMKDKFINNNAATENLFLADLRTYQDLVNEVKPNTFNFIFIDSLDNMRIGALELKELRKLYMNSALVTISQSTKEGKMRGSYEIVHDSDIAVSVSGGIAETVKNRFLEKGRKYKIFDADPGEGIMPWNTVKG
ncbi:MAG: hypothetical protein WCM76_08275 [Bacteroidota bacterium]